MNMSPCAFVRKSAETSDPLHAVLRIIGCGAIAGILAEFSIAMVRLMVKLLNSKELNQGIQMKKKTLLATLITALAAFSASAQIQTLVTGTNALNTNSAVISVPSDSYVQLMNASLLADYNLAVTVQGVTFNIDPLEYLINGDTFAGPATIQLQGDTYNPYFTTLDVVPLRKAVGTNVQTLVVSPANTNSAMISVPSNSVATIAGELTFSSAYLSVTVQGVLETYALQDVTLNGLTFTGPATIQLQGDTYGPSFATVEIMPMRKSAKTQFETLVVSPANTNSAILNVSTNNYATIISVDPNTDATVLPTVAGIPLSFPIGYGSLLGYTFAGPATLQLQGDIYFPGFITTSSADHSSLQTLITGTNGLNTNSAVINVSSNSYVQLIGAGLTADFNLLITMHGVPFDIDPLELPLINGDTFTGPATVQIQGDIYGSYFTTLNVASLRKAVGTNIQTLVVSPTNQTSETITVSSNSVATIQTAVTRSSANLLVTVQDASLSYALQDVSVSGVTFTGPATIQLQGDSYGPSFATVEIVPMRKSSKAQIQTLVVTPTNVNSATINVSSNSYATITSVDQNFDGTLVPTVDGIPLAFSPGEFNVVGYTFAGPASIQFQGDGFNPGFITVTTTRK